MNFMVDKEVISSTFRVSLLMVNSKDFRIILVRMRGYVEGAAVVGVTKSSCLLENESYVIDLVSDLRPDMCNQKNGYQNLIPAVYLTLRL